VAVLVCASHAVLFRPSTTPPLIFPNRERRGRSSRCTDGAPDLPDRYPVPCAGRILAGSLAGSLPGGLQLLNYPEVPGVYVKRLGRRPQSVAERAAAILNDYGRRESAE